MVGTAGVDRGKQSRHRRAIAATLLAIAGVSVFASVRSIPGGDGARDLVRGAGEVSIGHAAEATDESSPPAARPLAAFSRDAAAYLDSREGAWGVAVALPFQASLYTVNSGEYFPLASVAKLVILVALLDQADGEGRTLTEAEELLARDMITVSDNDAAAALWDAAGGSAGIQAFLDRNALDGVRPAPGGLSWGDTEATASGLAAMLVALWRGDLLGSGSRAFAIDLMTSVTDEQRWGASAAFRAEQGPIALKNGWYPAEDGWRVSSVAFPARQTVEPMFVIVLSAAQPTFEYALETIEHVADAIGRGSRG